MTDTASLGLEDRTARVIAGQRVWDELTPLLASRSCTLLAAIAYVGSHGGELIKLERGSSVIVDASVSAVRAGSTDPSVLAEWIGAGVGVYSLEGLHAKMILAESAGGSRPAFLIIGSANLSGSSAARLTESVILTDSRDCLDEARSELLAWKIRAGKPLTLEEVRALGEHYGADRSPGRKRSEQDDTHDAATPSEELPGSTPEASSASRQRPTQLLLVRLGEEFDPPSEVIYHRDRLSSELGCDDADSDSVLFVFRDQSEPEWRLPLSQGAYVIGVDASASGRVTKQTEVAPPGPVVYLYDDDDGGRYCYLHLTESSRDVTWADVTAAFESLGEKPEFDRNYFRKSAVDALLSLWPEY
ncbi:phosphatidylserine/phosphatidylglycerophosphate/cardiolipin synthase family protein [Rhodococcus zopfii]|uniref:Phosphatidylserine/phosphatidylglycerophosphate/ cardiolipin synthase family protein n=1 Tax=Rhodococcus zopfii TaxID=43772 RepID=A0ABU3WW18_9NOCA|nr:phosphatidylserine/phosphatidylglycerophosphate/cardiolipin synthase family protein [Rhodococcus zopfii]